ncbi:hypothetical protein [Arthrobacter roseus]|uniref:hypothetical protein n=1 Tax=Arthrobacter roseus TaxID=136274 RepID=UPI001963C956|nr:hypothetical protein [Arthrobacter roseus]MBM7847251.1 hypothetical protein [Arthrobacter roseus]
MLKFMVRRCISYTLMLYIATSVALATDRKQLQDIQLDGMDWEEPLPAPKFCTRGCPHAKTTTNIGWMK